MTVKMKAIVYLKFGAPDILQLMEIDKPIPGDGQVLVKIHAASVNIADYHTLRGVPFLVRLLYKPARDNGLSKPNNTRLGSDIAGQVESVGTNVTKIHPGDEVFGTCVGGFAEYALARQVRLVPKPDNCSYEEAAAVPVAAITALQGLRDSGKIQSGQRVLIDGASGGVGTFAVEIAKSYGAEVTAVTSTSKLETAQAIGADYVIDYIREDFAKNGKQYDLILCVNGEHPISAYRRLLTPNGIFVLAGSSRTHLYQGLLQLMILGPWVSKTSSQKMRFMGIAKVNYEDLVILRDLLEARKIVPVIDRRYPLIETAAALQYLAEGHARGKVILTMN